MSLNTVQVSNVTNQVQVTSPVTVVTPEYKNHTVVVDGQVHVLEVTTKKVTLTLVQTPVAVNVQSSIINVLTGGFRGPPGVDAVSDEIIVLNKAERTDTVEDTPAAGDITVYYGIAAPQSLNASAVWLITKQIFLRDGGGFDSEKRFASVVEDQIWDNRLLLPYS